jgi:hypothetical protein
LGFVVSCGGLLGFFGFLLEFWRFCWVWTRELVSEFDGKNVVFCWWGVVTLWFFDGAIFAARFNLARRKSSGRPELVD